MAIRVYTIGHSNLEALTFFQIIDKVSVEILLDVRSHPYSKYVPHFNRENLSSAITVRGLKYTYLGDRLGGHPDDPKLYDGKDHVVYERIAKLRPFQLAVTEVIGIASKGVAALLCTEEDPLRCHRHTLLARELLEHDIIVHHLRKDGRVQNARDLFGGPTSAQLPLIETPGEDKTWISPRRIRRTPPQM